MNTVAAFINLKSHAMVENTSVFQRWAYRYILYVTGLSLILQLIEMTKTSNQCKHLAIFGNLRSKVRTM